MCGRFSFVTSAEKVKQQLGDIQTGNNLRINYNVAPTQSSYIITNKQPDQLRYLTWGLIPYWAKEGKKSGRLINARSEGIASKPSFRMAVRQRRCLVLMDSFYEWQRRGTEKIPQRIFLNNGDLLLLAGIWERWEKGSNQLETFSIITTEPNREMQPIHNRMPVVLDTKEKQAEWLHTEKLDDALKLLETPCDGLLDMYQVSTKVNSVRNNSVELHQKIETPPNLFS